MRQIRCISWVAVSSEAQAEKESPDEQRRANAEFVAELGRYYPGTAGVIVAELETAHSRSVIQFRDAAEAMPAHAQLETLIDNKAADALICLSRDRLGRTQALIAQVEALCLRAGIVVVPRMSLPPSLDVRTVRRSDGNSIVSAVEASLAEVEIRRLQRRHEVGMAGLVKRGDRFPSNVPYGYAYEYMPDGDKRIVVDDSAAACVRWLLVDLYLGQEYSIPALLEAVQASDYPPPRDRWQIGSIKSILDNVDRYAGWLELNKKSRTGRKYLRVRGDYPPILSEAEAQDIQAERQDRATHTTNRRTRIFSGVAVCNSCNELLHGNTQYHTSRTLGRLTYDNMRCGNGECPQPVQIADARLMEAMRAVVDYLADVADTNDLIGVVDESRAEGLRAQLARLARVETATQEERTRLTRAYTRLGTLTEEEYTDAMRDASQRLLQVARDREQVETALEDAQNEGDVAGRIDEVRQDGHRILDMADADPQLVRRWLRAHFRIYVAPGATIDRVDYV